MKTDRTVIAEIWKGNPQHRKWEEQRWECGELLRNFSLVGHISGHGKEA